MADDYIGKKMEEYMARKGAPAPKRKAATSLGQLLLKNRSHRAFDHSFVVRRTQQGLALKSMLSDNYNNIVMVDYQPTCENLLADFAERLLESLPDEVELYSLRLHETATSYAEWFAEDNL